MTDSTFGDAVSFDEKSAPADRAINGPLDESEANAVRPYVDLGGVKILPRTGLQLRLEVEEDSKRGGEHVLVGLVGAVAEEQPAELDCCDDASQA